MTDRDCTRANTKWIASALVCQPCWVSCFSRKNCQQITHHLAVADDKTRVGNMNFIKYFKTLSSISYHKISALETPSVQRYQRHQCLYQFVFEQKELYESWFRRVCRSQTKTSFHQLSHTLRCLNFRSIPMV